MKKFTFIIATMLITSLTFAQLLDTPISVEAIPSGEKTDWYTYWEDDGSGYIGINLWTAGEKLAMRYTPAQLADMLDANPQLTKVSVGAWEYTHEGVNYNNYNFTLEIYEGGSYDDVTGEYTPGTMIHTQAITAAQSWTEHTLSTPVDVDITQDLMIAIVMTGNSCFIQSHSAVPTASTFGNLYYYCDPEESAWFDLEFYTDETMTETEVLAWAIKAYIEDEAVYVENSDMYGMFLGSAEAPYTPISELAIGETEDLVIFPTIGNNGPDATSNTVTVLIEAGENEIMNESLDLSGEYALANGYFSFIVEGNSITITAAELTTMGLTDEFDVCITVTYNGVDNVPANNTACLAVTRGDPVNVENNIAAAISVFPNPANSIITVANAENEDIVVLNMLGEVVANVNNASSNQNIDISKLANGTYFVKVDGEVFKINVVK
jgi:hypothetical protein